MPDAAHNKVFTHDELMARVRRARAAGRRIVQCHGCFDIVHPGHIRYLDFASRQGDVLLVTITGDADIHKGDTRPYIPQELRAESLAALQCVDWVYVDPNPTAEGILADVTPDVYVKGREYEHTPDPRFHREREIVERGGGRVIFSSGEVVFSSSKLIDTLPPDTELHQQRLLALCDRHGITREALCGHVARFSRLRALVIGDTVIDRYVFCDALDVASEAPVMALSQLDEKRYVGGAAIVARHVAALGGRAFLLTAAAHDQQTEHLEQTLGAEGVQSHLLRCRPRLVEKSRFLVDDSKLLKVESAEHVPLDSLARRRATDVLATQAAAADVVILCDFGFGMLSQGLLHDILPPLRRVVPIVTADISGPRANLLNFTGADLLCPTERELRANLNDFDSGLSTAAHALLQRTQAKHLFVTLEKKGLVAFDRAAQDPESPDWSARLRSEHLPSLVDRPIDRLGGGDALLAAASLALAAGGPVMHAAYLGTCAAALEIGQIGNVPIDRRSLERFLVDRTQAARHTPMPAIPAPA